MDDLSETMARNLSLTSKEDSDIDVGIGEAGITETEATFDLVGKVVAEKPYSAHALQQNIARLLRLVRGFHLQVLGENRFVLQFNHQLDRTHTLEGCPWLLDRNALLLSLIPEGADPENIELTMMHVVVRLQNIPRPLRNPEIGRSLGAKLGLVEDLFVQKGGFYQGYIRVRVQLNISEPLLWGTFLRTRDGVRHWVSFSYERLPMFCYLCGVIGHLEKKCTVRFRDDFVDPGKAFPYGEWLKATPGPAHSVPTSNNPHARTRESTHHTTGPSIFEFRQQASQGSGTMVSRPSNENVVSMEVPNRRSPRKGADGAVGGELSRATVKVSESKNQKKKAGESDLTVDGRPAKRVFGGELTNLVQVPVVAAVQHHRPL